MILHVALTGSDHADGTETAPLRTIQRAAELVRPGGTVRVHEGTYREWVRPVRGGLSDARRVTFEAAREEKVIIKGSERITGWMREDDDVWRAVIPNSLFGDFNPYVERIWGDWTIRPGGEPWPHLGEVYLDGRSFHEVFSRAAVSNPQRVESVYYRWTGHNVPLVDPDQSSYVWYVEVTEEVTTIWANFHGADPNEALVEINVRPAVFYPERNHLNYVTVRGFELAHAATPWTPPTADQPGLIGPNWAKGWIIEDNIIRDSKCSGISLGKEITTGHNYATDRGDKPGYQYQLEAVFTARDYGWAKEHIGSHIVRRNTIFDCGQNGIVGHLGCVFSTIEDNHIYRIGTKHEFNGFEIAAIKLHAPIDVQIIRNRIHTSTLGIWLDWQVQGTRISRNLLYNNTRDLFIEVCHGPTTVDHNVLASPISVELFSQGNAIINNLLAGAVRVQPVLDRATPYHLPHSTNVAGYSFIYPGDDRYYGNLFIGAPPGWLSSERSERVETTPTLAYNRTEPLPMIVEGFDPNGYGTHIYDEFPATWEEYLEAVAPRANLGGDHARFHFQRQAAYIARNAYVGGARPRVGEEGALDLSGVPGAVRIVEEGEQVWLEIEAPEGVFAPISPVITGADLGRVRIVDADFENPDGSPIVADIDLIGRSKDYEATYPAGPLAYPTSRIRVW
ncbi:MAG: DUF1565 domain-containing protein [Promicromonosporaceae bacterium]|nr:DUF1565 domain-containing protein [Promicromonosporaceae bacterium]